MLKQKKTPQRMCIGCQQMKSKRELIRVVRTVDYELLIDESGKKSGRGAYLCPDVSCLKTAIKAKRLQRALTPDPKKKTETPEVERVKSLTREDWDQIFVQLSAKIEALVLVNDAPEKES